MVLPGGWTVGTLHPTICYGDGTSDDFITLNTTHQYQSAGVYTACVVQKVVRISTNDTCCITTCKTVTIPVVTFFTAAYNCNTGLLTMTDGSSYYPSNTGATYTWTVTGGTYTGTLTNGPNQTITPTSSGSFAIVLSITLNGCTSTYNVTVPVVLPVAPITATPNPSCDGSPVFFSTPGMSCYWQFEMENFRIRPTPQHIYAGPGSYLVTLTATTPDGCVITTTKILLFNQNPL
ncbi:MAG: PKD domain-containing protein [Chitinophagaceae bacterium]|nr:PKD domain-containing protein [Chitinophagaceae bacterium]